MSVPVLRFPEFDGEWEEKRLGAIAPNPSYGLNASAIPFDGVHKYIRITDIDEQTREFVATAVTSPDGEIGADYKLEIGDILFARTGASTGKSYLYKEADGNVYFAGFLIRFRIRHADARFVFAQTLRRAFDLWITKMSMRSGQPGVNAKEFSSLTFATPSLPEQKKIAAFLGVVDAKIAALRTRRAGLERYKRGLMQALFSQTLRFTKPDGTAFPDWEEKRLGDISTKNDSGIYKNRDLYGSGCNIVGVSDLFSMNAIDGQTFRRVPLDDVELAKNTLDEGDILYAESSLVRAGIAKAVYVTARGAGTAFAWHTRRFSVDSQIANSAFIFYYLESEIARRYIEAVATQTALTGITTKDYFQTPVFLPHPDEQAKIADALTAMDAKIAAVGDQATKMEAFKKGLLQHMFV